MVKIEEGMFSITMDRLMYILRKVLYGLVYNPLYGIRTGSVESTRVGICLVALGLNS